MYDSPSSQTPLTWPMSGGGTIGLNVNVKLWTPAEDTVSVNDAAPLPVSPA
jgi:hypothetical protein